MKLKGQWLRKKTDFRLSDEQQEIVDADLDKPLLVGGGPGSGKTRIVVARLQRVIQEMQEAGIEKPHSRIMVTSHSKAAADELQERLEFVFGKYLTATMRLGTIHAISLDMMKQNLDPSTPNYRPLYQLSR